MVWMRGKHSLVNLSETQTNATMFKTLLLVSALVALAHCQADRYPAGLNPALCPNFPYCDNVALAHGQAHAHVQAPQARQYPAGVSPASCPNYPYCGQGPSGGVQPLPGFSARLYPSGVHPAACPNYPYCH